jgi:hypothetical protein
MPDWQIVTDAYARLLQVRDAFDNAVTEAVRECNAGSLPVLEVLAIEVEHLTRALLDALRPAPSVAPQAGP